MFTFRSLATLSAAALISLTACSDDDNAVAPQDANLQLNITGLEDLGDDFAYEGWIIVDGAPVTAGIFDVDATGNLVQTEFAVNADQLAAATAYVLTIEPSPDNDPAPSDVHILAGDFSGNAATLDVGHPAAINATFTDAAASYILATPTDGNGDVDELSGIWFLDPSTDPFSASLDLPTLPAGWAYEGWAVIDGQPVSTGTFTSVTGADAAAPFSGNAGGPPFPGEDFLQSAPAGLSFPTTLAGATAVISIEPVPDNSPAPFSLKPLVGTIPTTAVAKTSYTLDNNAVNTTPNGTVRR